MKFFKTNSGLGYGEWAYLVKLEKNKHLVLAVNAFDDYMYDVGSYQKDDYKNYDPIEVSKEEALKDCTIPEDILEIVFNHYNHNLYECFEREIVLVAEKGTNIHDVFKEAQHIAKSTGFIVTFDWNGRKIKVSKTTTIESVYGQMSQ